MTQHHLRFVTRQHVAHENAAHLRVQLFAHMLAWLSWVTLLSNVPVPVEVPLFGANLGAWAVLLCALYWIPADALTAILVSGATALWARTPLWGHGGVLWLLPLLVAAVTSHYARIYHHERTGFLNGSPWIDRAHGVIFGVFHTATLQLVRAGWRPLLLVDLDERASRAVRLREHVPWMNWAELASCKAQMVSAPGSIDELVTAVREARRRNLHIRVVASGFSWTSMCTSDDALLFCERLDRIEVDASDPARPMVWCDAGVTNRQLNAELARHQLCMPWNVVLETVRVAGLVSSGTHGTGKITSTVGDLVDAFEVIDVHGTLRVLSEETIGKEGMRAARLGLGLFGVIARCRLRVVPMYRVRQTDHRMQIATMLDSLPELVARHDSVELYWFPFNDQAWVRTIDRTDEPHTPQGNGFWFRAQNFVQNVFAVLFFRWLAPLVPSLTPALLKLGMNMLSFKTRVMDLPESHHYRHWIEMMPAGCLEVGFKADEGCRNVRRAWQVTEKIVDDYAKRGLYPLNLTLNVRFTGGSDALLTPAYGDGITCYVEIMWMGRPDGWDELSAQLCRAWLEVPGALPHWSKEFEHVPGIDDVIRDHLGDRRQRFLDALAQTGIDPDRALWNPLVRRILARDDADKGS